MGNFHVRQTSPEFQLPESKKMISPVFIVCSALLVVGAFARPESETVEIESRKAKEVAAQALPVIIGAIGDIIAGKDPVEVTLNRYVLKFDIYI